MIQLKMNAKHSVPSMFMFFSMISGHKNHHFQDRLYMVLQKFCESYKRKF